MSPSRLVWFALGGASAFWWIRKQNDADCRDRRNLHHGGATFWGHCMQHSWRHPRPSIGDTEASPSATSAQVDFETSAGPTGKPSTLWDSQTSEALAKTVETGVNTVMSIIENLEKSLREEKTRINEREAWSDDLHSQHSSPQAQARLPSDLPTTPLSEFKPASPHFEAPKAPTPPNQTSKEGDALGPVLTQVLATLEKINSKLDEDTEQKSNRSDRFPPRLV